MGNICRSPTAQGVFDNVVAEQTLANSFETDSAGTHAYHVGDPPDPRSQAAARQRGIDLSRQQARRVSQDDFEYFDYILAMDEENLQSLHRECVEGHKDKLQLFMTFAPERNVVEVPDPYYGGADGFEQVLDLIEAASQGFLVHLQKQKLR